MVITLNMMKMMNYDEYDILVMKSRMSVNNKNIIQMPLGYNWLITQKTQSFYAPVSNGFR